MTKYIKSILLASFILVTTSIIAQNNSDDGNGVMINLQEPEYAEMSFQDILDKYKGKVVYIDFWASWCGPCKKQMPYSAKIKKPPWGNHYSADLLRKMCDVWEDTGTGKTQNSKTKKTE
jgi:thiol-disulfide isomerase/thioredoxin